MPDQTPEVGPTLQERQSDTAELARQHLTFAIDAILNAQGCLHREPWNDANSAAMSLMDRARTALRYAGLILDGTPNQGSRDPDSPWVRRDQGGER